MDDRSPVITGLGIITPFGVGGKALHAGLQAGAEPHRSVPAGFRPEALLATVPEINWGALLRPHPMLRRIDRFTLLTTAAIALALEDGGLGGEAERAHVGLIGNSHGSYHTLIQYMETLCRLGAAETSATQFGNTGVGAAFGFASIYLGLKGAATVLMGSSAMSYAAELLQSGKAEALCICATHEVVPMMERAFAAMGLMEQGYRYGEAFVCILLETATHAAGRGAKPHARLAGWGEATEPKVEHPTRRPGADAAFRRAMEMALRKAGLAPADVGGLYTAACGLPQRDDGEQRALSALFGSPPPAAALRRAIGDAPGAGELAALAAAVVALAEGDVAGQPIHGNALLTTHADLWGPVSSLVITSNQI
ncbi:MAG: 3-oxoacyl-[acyl-carrier-protein] synthase / Chain length factor [Symbiobacteriaceae bacterium]|jgi:3-oxoacyl-[acyl-carrier-protein] synthase II|nr:3-oxoacyl-[acyl-carrier-protein] synthase / Chain length factor [Symbiobacteriaceae bacterium]